MLLVVARLPSAPRALVEAARLTGLALADVKTRLVGPLPRVLCTEADPERATSLATDLETLGFAAIALDPRAAPGDDERLVARAVRFAGGVLFVTDAQGEEDDVPLSALSLIQRGMRTTVVTEVSNTTERRLDLTRALLTGGLMLTKKSETKRTKTSTAREAFLVLHRSDGPRDVMLYERRLDYRFLGADLQPASAANFERLLTRLRAAAPLVPYDDRLNSPGLVSRLPVAPPLAVDVALWLVQLTHLRGGAE